MHLFEHTFPYSRVWRITLVYSHPHLFEHIFSLFQCTRKRRLYSINIYITYRLQLILEFPTSSTVSSTPQATERWQFKFVISGKTYRTNFWLAQTNKYWQLFQKGLFLKNFYCSEVSNIHLVTKYYKIVPLTNLLRLLLAGRVMGGCRSC